MIGLVELDKLLNTTSSKRYAYSIKGNIEKCIYVFVDFQSMSLVLKTEYMEYIRSPGIRDIYIEEIYDKDSVIATIIHMTSYFNEDFSLSLVA